MTLTDDDRRTIYLFKAASDLIPLGPDGYQAPNDFFDVNLQALSSLTERVATILNKSEYEERTPEEHTVNSLVDWTHIWIEQTECGTRKPLVAEARFQARAELVEPE